jgi:hypothetical protein
MTRVTIQPGRARWQTSPASRDEGRASICDHADSGQSRLRVCRLSLGSRVSATSFRNSTAGVVNQLEQTELGDLLDMPNDGQLQAGYGAVSLGPGRRDV